LNDINAGSVGNYTLTVTSPFGSATSFVATLIITSASFPVNILPPQLSSNKVFSFGFPTSDGQSYTVQQNANLATTNWTFYSNIIGNGSTYQFTTPTTNNPQLFFRVREP
jgi:hypothetical protein